MQKNEKPSVSGTVERVAFSGKNFSVCEINKDGESLTVAGNIGFINPGDELEAWGNFVTHPVYGLQFKADSGRTLPPTTGASMLKFIASGIVKGIGEKTAARIVSEFGEDTARVISEEPHLVARVRGMNEKKAESLRRAYNDAVGCKNVIDVFGNYNIPPYIASEAYKLFGNAAIPMFESNPYYLCSFGLNLDFHTADDIALKMGIGDTSAERVFAAFEYLLHKKSDNDGHTCCLLEELVDNTAQLLEIDLDIVSENVTAAETDGRIKLESKLDGEIYAFLPEFYRAEKTIASRFFEALQEFVPITKTKKALINEKINRLEQNCGITYAAAQRRAIELAVTQRVFVLTGGPGTGKTTTLNAIITLLDEDGEITELAAPTGRAAKRMSEMTGRDAQTIHRLLEAGKNQNGEMAFARNRENPLNCTAVIIDEMSMVDALLMESLISALKKNTRIIMVGDANQLPAVGAGNVLGDVLSSDCVPFVTLTEIFRQAQKSLIVRNAHRIMSGNVPVDGDKEDDYFFISRSIETLPSAVGELMKERIPKAYGIEPFEIQVIIPTKIGPAGTKNINAVLQSVLNPGSNYSREATIGDVRFREGDRVMQTKNNYDIIWDKDGGGSGMGIFNGDVGLLARIDNANKLMFVRFDDRTAEYTYEAAADLDLAYAITVHKSQGSEFRAVILPIHNAPKPLLNRRLLYTAATRAKELEIIIGSRPILERMVAYDREFYRCTALCDMLKSMIEGG